MPEINDLIPRIVAVIPESKVIVPDELTMIPISEIHADDEFNCPSGVASISV